jgi:hypothetical protein
MSASNAKPMRAWAEAVACSLEVQHCRCFAGPHTLMVQVSSKLDGMISMTEVVVRLFPLSVPLWMRSSRNGG